MNPHTSTTLSTGSAIESEEQRNPSGVLGSSSRRAVGLLVIACALTVTILLSLAFGANPLPLSTVWNGFFHPDDSEASIIIWTLRVPRTIVGVMAGVAFGSPAR